MVNTQVIGAIGVAVVGILVLLLVMGILTPISLDGQDDIYTALNDSGYVDDADITSARQDTGNILVNIPTFMWLSLLFVVLAGIGFSVFVAVKKRGR